MRLYGLKTCDGCRKAMKELAAAGHAPELVDVRENSLELVEIERFLSEFGEALVNRRSTTWRGMDETARGQDPLAQLQAHPSLMKRPLISDGAQMYLGWGKDVQAQLCGGAA